MHVRCVCHLHLLQSVHEDKHAYNTARHKNIMDAFVLCLFLHVWLTKSQRPRTWGGIRGLGYLLYICKQGENFVESYKSPFGFSWVEFGSLWTLLHSVCVKLLTVYETLTRFLQINLREWTLRLASKFYPWHPPYVMARWPPPWQQIKRLLGALAYHTRVCNVVPWGCQVTDINNETSFLLLIRKSKTWKFLSNHFHSIFFQPLSWINSSRTKTRSPCSKTWTRRSKRTMI